MKAPSFLKEHDIVLTIGSGGVYGAVIELSKSENPRILFTQESLFPVKSQVDAHDLSVHMLSTVHKCLADLHTAHKRHTRKVQVVLASPWFSSFSKTISIKKQTAFTVTEKTVDSLVSEYFESLAKSDAHTESFLLEKNISHIRLNGYETKNPYSQTAESIDVSVYASLAPVVIEEQIESEIYAVIHPGEVIFHTFPFVAWNVLNMLFSPKEDIAFIDIGSETTDLLIVRRGAIEKSASLPVGTNHLSRKIALAQDTYPELAQSLLSLESLDLLDSELKEKIQALISAFGEEWGISFFQIFDKKDKEHGHYLPQKAYFIADKRIHPVLDSVIKKQIADTVALRRDNISQFAEYDETNQPSTFLVLAAVYVSRMK